MYLSFLSPVWQKLEEENREFFKAYYVRLMLMNQINAFNKLLEQQYQIMTKDHPPGVPSMPPIAPNGSNSNTCKLLLFVSYTSVPIDIITITSLNYYTMSFFILTSQDINTSMSSPLWSTILYYIMIHLIPIT